MDRHRVTRKEMKWQANCGVGVLSQVAFLQSLHTHGGSRGSASRGVLIPPRVFAFSPSKTIASLPLGNSHLLFSLRKAGWKERLVSAAPLANRATIEEASEKVEEEKKTIRIGVVGGGIAGVSVANALAKKLLVTPPVDIRQRYKIVVLEGDPHSAAAAAKTKLSEINCPERKPQWHAATARNANSIVPGVAMHVFSRKSVMWDVLQDTITEWYYLKRESLQQMLDFSSLGGLQPTDKVLATTLTPAKTTTRRTENFAIPPPYFALHLWKCLGPDALPEERLGFIRYLKHYLYVTMFLGNEEADHRGRQVCELAKANRFIFLQEMANLNGKGYNIQASLGFLSLHRTLKAAIHSLDEAHEHGEEATILKWDEVVEKEPYLKNLPVKPLFGVHRPNDVVSSCEAFVHAWTQESRHLGVQFRGSSKVDRVERVAPESSDSKNQLFVKPSTFRARCKDGSSYDFDILVLAAGIHTPHLAEQLGVGKYCPVYPMRGFSLTIQGQAAAATTTTTTTIRNTDDDDDDAGKQHGFLLNQPFSIDSMYCSSVTPWMARWTGCGEFIGYPHQHGTTTTTTTSSSQDVVPSLGPPVLSRYARTVFPDAVHSTTSHVLSCFRPVSPDDLPLAGPVTPAACPGLFVHTGHGTLGWTTAMATGECVAQTIVESLQLLSHQPSSASSREQEENDKKMFRLAKGIEIERQALSPTRFA